MVKLRRNPKLRRDNPNPPPTAAKFSQSTQTSSLEHLNRPKSEADPVGIIYLLLALLGFGAAIYVLCLATPVLAVAAMLICLFVFVGKSRPHDRREG